MGVSERGRREVKGKKRGGRERGGEGRARREKQDDGDDSVVVGVHLWYTGNLS